MAGPQNINWSEKSEKIIKTVNKFTLNNTNHEHSPDIKSTTSISSLEFPVDNIFSATGLNSESLSITNLDEQIISTKNECREFYKKFHYLIKDISIRLREHKCIGALDNVTPVFVLLEDLRFMLQEIAKSSIILGGLISHKNRSEIDRKKIETPTVDKIKLKEKQEVVKATFDSGVNTEFVNDKKTNYSKYFCFMSIFFVIMYGVTAVLFFWKCGTVNINQTDKVCPVTNFIKKQSMGDHPY